jgi:hypothetical protein
MKKINVITINMKTSDITWKIVILQKFRKKNQWIWSYYDWETLVSNFNYRLKRKNDGGNEVTVRHVVPVKQLGQPSVATRPRSSMGSYIKELSSKYPKCWSAAVVVVVPLVCEVSGSSPVRSIFPSPLPLFFSRDWAGRHGYDWVLVSQTVLKSQIL